MGGGLYLVGLHNPLHTSVIIHPQTSALTKVIFSQTNTGTSCGSHNSLSQALLQIIKYRLMALMDTGYGLCDSLPLAAIKVVSCEWEPKASEGRNTG